MKCTITIAEGRQLLFTESTLEYELLAKYSVKYVFEEGDDFMIWRVILDHGIWFEMVCTQKTTTINLSSTTFLLRGNQFILDIVNLTTSHKVHTSKDIEHSFNEDLIYPKSIASNLLTRTKEAICILIMLSTKFVNKQGGSTTTTPEKAVAIYITKMAELYYSEFSTKQERDYDFEESILTAKKILGIHH